MRYPCFYYLYGLYIHVLNALRLMYYNNNYNTKPTPTRDYNIIVITAHQQNSVAYKLASLYK